jgi:hypothetical protein
MDDEDYDDDDGSEQVSSVLMKGLLVIVLIGVVIALGTTIVVRALGLNEGSSSSGPVGSDQTEVTTPLPTTALPVPGEGKKSEEDEFKEQLPPKSGKKGRIQLDVFPVMARPNERVNLTGTYRKADNIGLQVQRYEDGKWSDFGVSATVRVGTFETYVMTGQSGEQRFRMYDPGTKQGSNVVLVTID